MFLDKGTYVVAARPDFRLLTHNVFTKDDRQANASPGVSKGQLILRTNRYL
jgi:hypothetical protein